MPGKPLTYVLSLRIVRQEKCFGKGIVELLELVDAHHSLRRATQEMNIAYSKAWNVIKISEQELGFKLLETTAGGRHGGGATLTPQARELLKNFKAFHEEVDQSAKASFEKFFGAYQ